MQEFDSMNRSFASSRNPRTIALVGKYHSMEIAESLRRLAEYLYERGVSVFIERETSEHIGKKVDLSAVLPRKIACCWPPKSRATARKLPKTWRSTMSSSIRAPSAG